MADYKQKELPAFPFHFLPPSNTGALSFQVEETSVKHSGGHSGGGCEQQRQHQNRGRRPLLLGRCVAVVRVADAPHRGPGPARLGQATLVRWVARRAVTSNVLEVAIQVVLGEELASLGTFVGEVLFRIEVRVGAEVCPVGLVSRRPTAYVALDSVTCREEEEEE